MSVPGFRSLMTVLSSGFDSAGIVMGAGAYQIYQPLSCGYTASAARATMFPAYHRYQEALGLAWWDVVARLEDEARRVEAHGVVGVYLIEQPPAPGQSVMELQLIGTAVRVPGEPPLRRPFLSMLSMDETLRLLLRGWVASGIIVGVSAVHVHSWNASPALQGVAFKNVEMEAPTAGLMEARAQAQQAARAMLQSLGAGGMVASTVDLRRVTGGEGLLIEGRLLGTGVVRFGEPVAPIRPARNLTKGRTP